ncbi:hypothetical protein F4808DRAFT_459374 [Astrocystis sublimbata]|nr:hypothetical protein F4808DRAFT_459374 [Astrocystis sublimbata]
MFRARANPIGLLVAKPRQLRRAFGTADSPPRVRLLSPALWSIAACSTIYLGSATYEVYQDAQRAKRRGERGWPQADHSSPLTFEELQSPALDRFPRPSHELSSFDDPGDVTKTTMAVTAALHLASSLVPSMQYHFLHIPAMSPNYTLLTSVFSHTGLIHLGVNMYGMYMFMPAAAASASLGWSGPHLAAFFTSAGILSSLAHHATAVWPGRSAYTASLGASGALFAMLGVVGISFPNTQLGLLFVPGSLPIGEAMVCLALFDAIGMFYKYPFLNLGHAAHLSGLMLGVAYAKANGGKKVWRPGRRVAFTAMRSLGVI